MQGKAIVLVFAILIVGAGALFVVYKAKEAGLPATSMRFDRSEPPTNATFANTTRAMDTQGTAASGLNGTTPDRNGDSVIVHVLPYKPVHAAYFLEDHLDTASLKGTSSEDVRLRVQAMQDTLTQLTGHAGPEWWVLWEGVTIHITLH